MGVTYGYENLSSGDLGIDVPRRAPPGQPCKGSKDSRTVRGNPQSSAEMVGGWGTPNCLDLPLATLLICSRGTAKKEVPLSS